MTYQTIRPDPEWEATLERIRDRNRSEFVEKQVALGKPRAIVERLYDDMRAKIEAGFDEFVWGKP